MIKLTTFIKANILDLLAYLNLYLYNKVFDLLEGFLLLLVKLYPIEARVIVNKVGNILKLYITFVIFNDVDSDYFKGISLDCLSSL